MQIQEIEQFNRVLEHTIDLVNKVENLRIDMNKYIELVEPVDTSLLKLERHYFTFDDFRELIDKKPELLERETKLKTIIEECEGEEIMFLPTESSIDKIVYVKGKEKEILIKWGVDVWRANHSAKGSMKI